MIRNDHTHAQGICQLNLWCRGNSVITGDDHANAFPLRLFDEMLVQSITVMNPVWDCRIHLCAKHLKPFGQDIRRADSVHIIIPDDPDMQTFLYRFQNLLHCPVHILKQPGRVAVLQFSIEELLNLALFRQIPVSKDPRRHRTDMKFLRPFIKICLLCSHIPFFHAGSHFRNCFSLRLTP